MSRPSRVTAMTASNVEPPFFHEESQSVRFWIRTGDGGSVGAIARRDLLRYRFRSGPSDADLLATYLAHRHEIDAATLRRVNAGSLEPVILRETDFPKG